MSIASSKAYWLLFLEQERSILSFANSCCLAGLRFKGQLLPAASVVLPTSKVKRTTVAVVLPDSKVCS